MKLVEATIHNYRCVGSDCLLRLDSRVTTLVGKSESGKTAILQAMARFFDPKSYGASELCSWRQPAEDQPMCSIRFEPNQDEQEMLTQLHESLGQAQSVLISKSKDGSHRIVDPDIGTATVQKLSPHSARRIGNLRARARRLLRLTQDFSLQFSDVELENISNSLDEKVNAHKLLHPATTPENQRESLGEAASEIDRHVERVTAMVRWAGDPAKDLRRIAVRLRNDIEKTAKEIEFEAQEASAVPAESLLKLLPTVRFVSDRDIYPITDAVPLSELGSGKHAAVVRLLALGDIEKSDLLIEDETVRNRKLFFGAQRASNALTQRWSQEDVQVRFDVSGNLLRLEFLSEEGHYGNPSQRSEGFLWFLTFLLTFMPPASEERGSSLLLLDEPGIHLHASAQGDLLALLETIAGASQIIYTTHSPFMINKNFPWRIRAVRKNKRGVPPDGTYAENKPYASPTGRAWEPIRSSIGLSSGSSLFVAGNNLVVEGIADQIMLAAFSQRLAFDERSSIDLDRISITPAGGADRVYALAHLCHAETDATVVLLDSDAAGDKTKRRIEKGRVIPPQKVIQVGDIASDDNHKAVELEDLVDPRFYHAAVLNAYSKVPAKPELPESFERVKEAIVADQRSNDPPRGKMSVKKTYQRLFESNADDWGSFDNVLVARELAETCLGEAQPEGLPETLDNFSRLFDNINSRFP